MPDCKNVHFSPQKPGLPAFFHHGNKRALDRIQPAHDAGSGGDGLQQAHSLFVGAAAKSGSYDSIIGGWLGAAACGLSPSAILNKLWWAPTLLDVIGVPYLLILAWTGVREIMRAEDAA